MTRTLQSGSLDDLHAVLSDATPGSTYDLAGTTIVAEQSQNIVIAVNNVRLRNGNLILPGHAHVSYCLGCLLLELRGKV